MKSLLTWLILILGVLSLTACDDSGSSPQSITSCPTGLTAAAASQVPAPAGTPTTAQPCSFQSLSLALANTGPAAAAR